MKGKEGDIRDALENPDEIRRSSRDPDVYLCYKGKSHRWLCAVVKKENGAGFLITAYPTDSIKMGETIWTKSK